MTNYRLYLRSTDRIIARQDFEARDDASALVIAAAVGEASADLSDRFDVWHETRQVDRPAPCLASDRLRSEVQAQVVETEEPLLASRWMVACSQRLLARFRELQKDAANTGLRISG